LYAYVRNDPLNATDSYGLTADNPSGATGSSDVGQSSVQPATSDFAPVTISSGSPSNNNPPIQLAAVDDPQRLGRPPIEGGGGGGGGFSRGGSPPISGQGSGPPASSFSGSRLSPMESPAGAPPRNSP